jgi:hypothetical protein
MLTKESEMSTNRRSRTAISVFAAVLTLALSAPLAVNADKVVTGEDEVLVVAPVTAPGVAGTSGDDVRATRALAAQGALQSGEMGSLQEEHLRAIVAAAPSWDETSGYGAVEASRATIAYPAASASAEETRVLAAQQALQSPDLGSLQEDALFAVVASASTAQVPADVRWAPADTIGPASSRAVSPGYLPVALGTGTRSESVHLATIALPSEQTRVRAAQQALQRGDLGSMQEDALRAVVSAGQSWDETSGYRSVEASRATIGHPAASTTTEAELLAQFRAIELALSRSLGAVE